MRGIAGRANYSAGLESTDDQQATIAAIKPIERPNEGVSEGTADQSTQEKPKKDFGDGGNTLRENDEVQHVNEMQAAAEAIQECIATYRRQAAALEEIADQLDDTVPEGGVSPETAAMLQTALGASEVPEVQDAVAVESFEMSRVVATTALANRLRSRARAMGSVIDRFQAKAFR